MNENTCAFCQKTAFLTCAACKSVYYCNKEHQKLHWKNDHKNNCAPYKMSIDDILGRHLVATRDIKEGEIILRKYPLVLGPKLASYPICLGCHKKLSDNSQKVQNCQKCYWPLCGKVCEKSDYHKDECKIFTKYSIRPNVTLDNCIQTVYAPIAIIRSLILKEKSKKKFESLTAMQSHFEENINTPMYTIFRKSLVPLLLNVMKMETTEKEILTICSIFDTNSFDIRDSNRSINIRGLYPIISLAAHDCKQNTKHSFEKDFQIVLTATMPIKKGEVITVTYTQTLWGTLARRAHLKRIKHFLCICNRCSDPTEYGTYAGAVFCQKCRQTYLNDDCPKIISTNPLKENSNWKCERCENTVKANEIISGYEILKKEVSAIDKSHPKYLEDFLIKYRDVLHSRNCHVLEVKYALTQMYGNVQGFTLSELSDEDLQRKISLCRELLEVADLLQPGLSKFRGSLLYDLQEAMIEQAKRNFNSGKVDKEITRNLLLEAMDILKEASKILIAETEMRKILPEKMENLEKLIKTASF